MRLKSHAKTIAVVLLSTVCATLATKVGKHLPTAREWYDAVRGTPDPPSGAPCHVDAGQQGKARATGENEACRSDVGAFDMVGNVWEWTSDAVTNGMWHGRALPDSEKVAGIDMYGVPFRTDTDGATEYGHEYGHDYFWLGSNGVMGLMRGGYFASGADAGLFALYAASPPEFAGRAVGFRCARTLEI